MMNFQNTYPQHPEGGTNKGESYILGAAARRARASLLAVIFGPATRQWLEKHLTPLKEGRGFHPGSGGGEGAFLLASLLGEKTAIYGIDEDAALVGAALQEKARLGLGYVHFAQARLAAWNAGQPYDFIYTRIQAAALPAPEAWLASLSRNLKAGGVLLAEVIKPSGFRAYPYNHAFARTTELIGRLEAAQTYEAEQLSGRLQQAGFTDIVCTYAAPAFIPPACNPIASLSLECCQAEILRCGHSNREELNALLLELRTYEQQEDCLISRPGVLQVRAGID
ncbi:MAG: methyltransferase domain-containing protein [Phaeodactylibacter sp.]|nr:methyltransferase domain-containing protein [Phaeodactylibacter sp.]